MYREGFRLQNYYIGVRPLGTHHACCLPFLILTWPPASQYQESFLAVDLSKRDRLYLPKLLACAGLSIASYLSKNFGKLRLLFVRPRR